MQPNTGGALQNYFNSPELTQAQGQYQAAAGTANQSAAEDISLPTQLRQALAAKFGEDNPLIQQRAQASTDYLNSIPSSYNDVLPQNNNGVILSPTQQAMMIGAKQNAYLGRVANANSLISSQSGSLKDLIEAAAAAHQGETKLKLSKAELAHQNYADILGKLSAQADQAYKQQALSQEKLLREEEMGIQRSKFQFDMLGGLKGLAQKQLTELVKGKNGMTLKDALSHFGNQLNPDEIYAIYNTTSGRGPATENSAQLSDLGIKPTEKSKQQDALGITKGTINNLLDQYSQIKTNPFMGNLLSKVPLTAQNNYEKQRLGLATALKDISGAGAGSGVRVTQTELNNWAQLLPSPKNTESVNKNNIISLDKNLKAKFHGQGLDSQYLAQFGISTGGKGGWQ